MPVDPQRLAQDARVESALDVLQASIEHPAYGGEQRTRELELIAAVCAAHLDALVTPESLEAAAKAMWERIRIGFPEDEPMEWGALSEAQRQSYRFSVEAAAPLLVAPYVQEIERLKGHWAQELHAHGYHEAANMIDGVQAT